MAEKTDAAAEDKKNAADVSSKRTAELYEAEGEESQDSAMMDDSEHDDEGSSDEEDDEKSEEKDGAPPAKRPRHSEGEDDDDNDDDEKDAKGDDDGDENSDAASQRQSKRKPSKSRIKRILPQDLPAHSSLSPDAPYPYANLDPLMMAASARMNQPSMVTALAQNYLERQTGQRRPSGELNRGYQCNICGKEFRVPSRYESHMLSHSKGKPFCCDVCGKLFASQQKLDVHKPVHSRSRKDSFSCPTCGHVCTNWRAYLYHVAKHTSNGGKKHVCQVCGRQFHAAQRLRNHMQSHIEGKNFCCLICGKLFESQKRLDTHSIIHDTQRREPFKCVDCGKLYDDWRAFKQHMKTHGSEGVIYRCEICSAQFFTQYEKEKHKRVHTSDKRYQCRHCHKCFRSQSMLSVHERKHMGEKGHECMVCGREFSRAFSLKQHMKMHAGEEQFMCHLCGRTFASTEELTAHGSEHAGEREFVCDQCGKSFALKNHYHRHLIVHAAGQPLSCGVCGKLFETQSQLQSHGATHRGAGRKNFACLACSEVFGSQVELEAHAHTHGKSPPFVCGLCGKMFAEQRYFRQHMKRHTARAQKEKLQAQGLATPTGKKGENDTKTSPGSLGHTCHMCGQQWSSRQALIEHIEDHKRSGLLMYFNLMDGQMRATSQAPKGRQAKEQQGGQESGSDEESETASESEGSEETEQKAAEAKGSTGQGQKTASRGQKGAGKGSSLTEIAERAMALRMQPPTSAGSHTPPAANPSMSVGRASVIQPDGMSGGGDVEDRQSQEFASPSVFPSQNHATRYHAAAQPFQHTGQAAYPDYDGHQGRGDMQQQFGSPQKGLPGFADFRRQFGLYPDTPISTGNSYDGSYVDPMTSTPQYAGAGQGPVPTSYNSSFSGQPMMPHSAAYMPDGKQMPGAYNSNPPVPNYPVFPGMQAQGVHGNMATGSQSMPQPGEAPQYEPMLQFQPLSS